MKDIRKRIEELQAQLKRHRRPGLKELPTRTIFIDSLLDTLGWNVRDPDEVELEYPTIDSKAVDYALKINKKPVSISRSLWRKDHELSSSTQTPRPAPPHPQGHAPRPN